MVKKTRLKWLEGTGKVWYLTRDATEKNWVYYPYLPKLQAFLSYFIVPSAFNFIYLCKYVILDDFKIKMKLDI